MAVTIPDAASVTDPRVGQTGISSADRNADDVERVRQDQVIINQVNDNSEDIETVDAQILDILTIFNHKLYSQPTVDSSINITLPQSAGDEIYNVMVATGGSVQVTFTAPSIANEGFVQTIAFVGSTVLLVANADDTDVFYADYSSGSSLVLFPGGLLRFVVVAISPGEYRWLLLSDISEDAYNATDWDNIHRQSPSMNAVRDKFVSIDATLNGLEGAEPGVTVSASTGTINIVLALGGTLICTGDSPTLAFAAPSDYPEGFVFEVCLHKDGDPGTIDGNFTETDIFIISYSTVPNLTANYERAKFVVVGTDDDARWYYIGTTQAS